ncbi:threonylcarbamoyl-AMP synthase [Diorhabda carinulata]|uniref:threonylcarbamoyl-AMP synthase n=1 Tax=Diorhabda carinulata TaxID=1163345 RepID=UPI0025A23BC7|nr:threonylcarbamoyl-AMP synthase [Diorhabda carinulata]
MILQKTLILIFKGRTTTIKTKALFSMATHIPITNNSAEALGVKYLKHGSVIAVPTDTVYGLACDATNEKAINNLYSIKCRNENKPLAICLSEVSDVKNWAYADHLPENILNSLLPGPITIILRCTNNTLDHSLTLKGKIGIRIPNCNFIRNLSRGLGKPLALTSANLSNQPSAVKISEFRNIWENIPVIFDGGKLKNNNNASTVVDLSDLDSFHIVREGVACQDIINTLLKFNLKDKYPLKNRLVL